MINWNVIVTAKGEEDYTDAKRNLLDFGPVRDTDYYNVLSMEVEDIEKFLKDYEELTKMVPTLKETIAHITPVEETFSFESREDFETKAGKIAKKWAPRLAGKTFYVRVHRRGKIEGANSQDLERAIGSSLMEALEEKGESAEVTFDNPDAIVTVQTLGNEAGMSLWTREELEKYSFLGVG